MFSTSIAGVEVPNVVQVYQSVIGHFTNDHYLIDTTVTGQTLNNGTSENFIMLSMDTLLGTAKSSLGKNNQYITDGEIAVPLTEDGLFEDKGFGTVAILNNAYIVFGRIYKADGSFGGWPMSKMKSGGKYTFRFNVELY